MATSLDEREPLLDVDRDANEIVVILEAARAYWARPILREGLVKSLYRVVSAYIDALHESGAEIARLRAAQEQQAAVTARLRRAVDLSQRVYEVIPLDPNEPDCDSVAWMPDNLFAEWVDALDAADAFVPPAPDKEAR